MSNFWISLGLANPWKDMLDKLKEEEAERMKMITEAKMKKKEEALKRDQDLTAVIDRMRAMEDKISYKDSLDQLINKPIPIKPSMPLPPPFIAGQFKK
jgi:hypothetical protein